MTISFLDLAGIYLNHPDLTDMVKANALSFLKKAEGLIDFMHSKGVEFKLSPSTLNLLSGENAGFRPQDCPIGASNSAHKEGRAADIYDPNGEIDKYCLENQDILKAFGIYIEHPSATKGWSHWTDRAPPSGHTVFYP